MPIHIREGEGEKTPLQHLADRMDPCVSPYPDDEVLVRTERRRVTARNPAWTKHEEICFDQRFAGNPDVYKRSCTLEDWKRWAVDGIIVRDIRAVPFPIMADWPRPASSVSWEDAERAYETYTRLFGHNQSLEMIAQRGGFGREEFDALYAGRSPADPKP